MFRRRFLIIGLSAFFALVVAVPAWQMVRFVRQPIAPPTARIIRIVPGTPLARVARELEAGGIIADARLFKLLARWRDAAQRIKTGEYAFEQPATPDTVLARLVSGDVLRHPFTVPEGLTLREIATRLEAEHRGSAAAFLKWAYDPELREQWQIPGPSLEGYLFPETYLLTSDMDEKALVEMMLGEFKRRLTPAILAGAEHQGLSRAQLVILASIIQKEAGNQAEMPLIASVFLNRLARRIPLQADPTVIYGIDRFDGNLTRTHLMTETPYNTYRFAGLPVGPIANPGADALRAVAFPATSDYLYFVAKGDGTHIFAKTLAEHNANVRRYQLKR